MGKIRVVIADDHAYIREILQVLINKTPDLQVVGEASDGLEAVECVSCLSPDVLLLDIEMPGRNGIWALQELQKRELTVKVLVLSTYADRQYVRSVLEAGAHGYLTKGEEPRAILQAIRRIGEGEVGVLSEQIKELV